MGEEAVVVGLVSMVFVAVTVTCGVHHKMDVQMVPVLVDGGEDLVLHLVVMDALSGDFLNLTSVDRFFWRKAQNGVTELDSLFFMESLDDVFHFCRRSFRRCGPADYSVRVRFTWGCYVFDNIMKGFHIMILLRSMNDLVSCHSSYSFICKVSWNPGKFIHLPRGEAF